MDFYNQYHQTLCVLPLFVCSIQLVIAPPPDQPDSNNILLVNGEQSIVDAGTPSNPHHQDNTADSLHHDVGETDLGSHVDQELPQGLGASATEHREHPNDEEYGVLQENIAPGEKLPGQHDHGTEACEACSAAQGDAPDHHPRAAQGDAPESNKVRDEAMADEVRVLRPNVKFNVHDPRARTAAEFMKNLQYGPGDVETILHGGEHVHSHDREQRKPILAGNVGLLVHGEHGTQESAENEKLASTFDPESLLHDGHEHVHDQVEGQVEDIGPSFEKAVHGSDHIHDHQADDEQTDSSHIPRKIISYQDILDLDLSEDTLKGIDLTELLAQEQRSSEEWKKIQDEIYHSEL